MRPTSDEAAKAIANCWVYLHEHRGRTHYRTLRRGGYPLGSGGIESSNKFICHVRLEALGGVVVRGEQQSDVGAALCEV